MDQSSFLQCYLLPNIILWWRNSSFLDLLPLPPPFEICDKNNDGDDDDARDNDASNGAALDSLLLSAASSTATSSSLTRDEAHKIWGHTTRSDPVRKTWKVKAYLGSLRARLKFNTAGRMRAGISGERKAGLAGAKSFTIPLSPLNEYIYGHSCGAIVAEVIVIHKRSIIKP